jgi:hypothetical protein
MSNVIFPQQAIEDHQQEHFDYVNNISLVRSRFFFPPVPGPDSGNQRPGQLSPGQDENYHRHNLGKKRRAGYPGLGRMGEAPGYYKKEDTKTKTGAGNQQFRKQHISLPVLQRQSEKIFNSMPS